MVLFEINCGSIIGTSFVRVTRINQMNEEQTNETRVERLSTTVMQGILFIDIRCYQQLAS